MRFLNLSFLILLLALANFAYGQNDFRPTVGAVFPDYTTKKGKPIDFKRFYPLELVEGFDQSRSYEGANQIARRPNTVLVGNFNHKGDRYVAEIPLASITKLYAHFAGQSVTLMRLGHQTMIFELDPAAPPIRYYRQMGDGRVDPTPVEKKGLSDDPFFALSGNALGPPDVTPNLMTDGMRGGRILSYNLKSRRDLATENEIAARGSKQMKKEFISEAVQLDILSPLEVQEFFKLSIVKYDQYWLSNVYNMACNNCASPHYKILEKVKPPYGPFQVCGMAFTFVASNSPGRLATAVKMRGYSSGKIISGDEIPFFK